MRNLFQRNEEERAGQEVDDFSQYRIRIFKAVPPNMALICQNIFTGRPFVKNSGLVILMPWVKSKMVSLARNTIDYPKEKYRTSDGIEVTVDLALVFSILDPVKYEFNNNDPMQELKTKTQDMLRQYVASKTADEMITHRHTLSDFDSNRDYDIFTYETGIKINEVSFKTVELPQSMKDDYEKQKVQERENARLLAEAQNKKAVALIEAEARLAEARIDAETNKILGTVANTVLADEIRKILEEIDSMETDPYNKLELVKTQLLSSSDGDKRLFIGMPGSAIQNYLISGDSVSDALDKEESSQEKDNDSTPRHVRVRRKK